jgi:hypothetical protein
MNMQPSACCIFFSFHEVLGSVSPSDFPQKGGKGTRKKFEIEFTGHTKECKGKEGERR